MSYENLNPQQKEAVDHSHGPLLINAGAGSGKTHTIIERMIRLISDGVVQPENIFAVTFTNKAAKEMKDRVAKRVSSAGIAGTPILGTFHSLSARFLREYAHLLGYDKGFSIYDTGDVTKLVKSIMKDEGIDNDVMHYSDIIHKIDKFKTNDIPMDVIEKRIRKDSDRFIFEFYKVYEKRLKEENAMDFNGLLINFLRLLEIPEVLDKLQRKFTHFFVDEYQDTNGVQYKIMKLLASKDRNICVIGDDWQSIYSFRSADMKNILKFTEDYPDAKVIKLERNYRSSSTIVEAADAVIKKNKVRMDKKSFSLNGKGEPIRMSYGYNGYTEAESLAKKILEKKDFSKWGVLYRNNYISGVIENVFIQNKIPYRVYGGLAFVERMEVKDVMGYLNVLVNPKDSNSFKRVINVPTRGLGAKSVSEIVDLVKKDFGGNFMEAMKVSMSLSKALSKKAYVGFAEFSKVMLALDEASHELKLGEFMNELLTVTKYWEYLEKHYEGDELEDKQGNVGELLSMASAYEGIPGYDAVIEFVEKIALMTDANEGKSDDGEYVSLMTIHKSKGLEFDNVAVVALEDGILPSKNAFGEEPAMEEERRLMYVAMTRAKHRLFLSNVGTRTVFGAKTEQIPSRFLKEIPMEHVYRD